jgi:hypothetical protein
MICHLVRPAGKPEAPAYWYAVGNSLTEKNFPRAQLQYYKNRYVGWAGGCQPTDGFDVIEEVTVDDFCDLDWRKTGYWTHRHQYRTSGWIDREGTWYGCDSQEHDVFIDLIFKMTVHEAEEAGWVRVYGRPRSPEDDEVLQIDWSCRKRTSEAQRYTLRKYGYDVDTGHRENLDHEDPLPPEPRICAEDMVEVDELPKDDVSGDAEDLVEPSPEELQEAQEEGGSKKHPWYVEPNPVDEVADYREPEEDYGPPGLLNSPSVTSPVTPVTPDVPEQTRGVPEGKGEPPWKHLEGDRHNRRVPGLKDAPIYLMVRVQSKNGHQAGSEHFKIGGCGFTLEGFSGSFHGEIGSGFSFYITRDSDRKHLAFRVNGQDVVYNLIDYLKEHPELFDGGDIVEEEDA